ncbi:chloride conductance regulatory protein ICln-like [Zingiber officinale]|uniref:chloride conductance regulatory protein ICln-like n=1 Tax=Zingiber officinale TaxID=94328 RepID=UPI001C4B7D90|nr:chloride conductance regulatory protein ICln-like [Zingiber officinale]
MGLGMLYFDGRVVDDDGRPLLESDDDEELMHVEPGVAIALGSRPMESPGTLYVTSRCEWILQEGDLAEQRRQRENVCGGFLVVVPPRCVKGPGDYPFPCIYTQIEIGDEDEESESSDSESNDDLELSKVTEMRLLPSDARKCVAESFVVNFLFNAIMSVFVKVGKNLMQLALLHHGF